MKIIISVIWIYIASTFFTASFVEKLDLFDRYLCCNLPRPLRWRWRLLWLRKDEFHPAYARDYWHEHYLRINHKRREYNLYQDKVANHRHVAHKLDNQQTDKKYGMVFL